MGALKHPTLQTSSSEPISVEYPGRLDQNVVALSRRKTFLATSLKRSGSLVLIHFSIARSTQKLIFPRRRRHSRYGAETVAFKPISENMVAICMFRASFGGGWVSEMTVQRGAGGLRALREVDGSCYLSPSGDCPPGGGRGVEICNEARVETPRGLFFDCTLDCT
jgi:hypothetical protein